MTVISNGRPLKFGQRVKAPRDSLTFDPDGMVSKSGRWFPMTWWDGHFFGRNRCGEFGSSDASCAHRGDKVAERRRFRELARKSTARRKAAGAATSRSEIQAAYRDYLESRQRQAEKALRGASGVTPEGERRGVREGDFFRGGRAPMRYASPELRAWFGRSDVASIDGAGGPNLTYSQFERQYRETLRDRAA